MPLLRAGRGRRLALILVAALALAALAWRAAQPTPVETHRPAPGRIAVAAHGPGSVQARIGVTVASRSTAAVEAVHADQGEQVRRGQLLAELDDRDTRARAAAGRAAVAAMGHQIEAAAAALAKAEADLRLARANRNRDGDLGRAGFLSPAALESRDAALHAAVSGLDGARATLAARRNEAAALAREAEAAAALASHARIAAPIDGIVIERQVEAGDTVVPGAGLFRLIDPATLWIAARIDTTLVGGIREGQPASVRLRSGASLAGRVARITRQADAATRDLEVDIALDAPPQRFALNEEAEVSIALGEAAGLLLPAGALLRADGREGVLVIEEGRARFRPIRRGAADATHVVVAEGLAEGEAVVADPQGLAPGRRVIAR